ncbi:MAG: hypothetical protein ABR922_12680, partial [Streptosporangiaceae bacterium]
TRSAGQRGQQASTISRSARSAGQRDQQANPISGTGERRPRRAVPAAALTDGHPAAQLTGRPIGGGRPCAARQGGAYAPP